MTLYAKARGSAHGEDVAEAVHCAPHIAYAYFAQEIAAMGHQTLLVSRETVDRVTAGQM